jgi:hypothetical protein
VLRAKLTSVCCEEGKSTVFIGVQERAGSAFEYNRSPQGTVSLPADVVRSYDEFMDELARQTQAGDLTVDHSEGHALYSAASLRPFQTEFIRLARSQTELLKSALEHSSDPKAREIAAWILGYAQDKHSVLDELIRAVRDPQEGVRNNATRALGAIAVLAKAKPQLHIQIQPDLFIDMLNSLSWSDRNKAMMVLLAVVDDQTQQALTQMRQKALPALVEMARWKDGHSLMALLLVGRIAGITDAKTEAAWREGRREEIIVSVRVGPE